MLCLLRGVGWLLFGLAGIVATLALVARLLDGPWGPFPGGSLVAAELVAGPEPDWTFAAETGSIEMQMADGRVVVRVAGKRYERLAMRVTDPGRLAVLRAALGRKVGLTPSADGADDTWFFSMGPRPAS